MSTRGVIGFHIDGQDKLTYNHSDSFPSGLGADTLKWLKAKLKKSGLDALAVAVRALRPVAQGSTPSLEDIEHCRKWANTSVSTGKLTEWYCLLRNAQGDLDATLEAGVMIDGHDFATRSLFCEWGYVINLDAKTFEVYKGFVEGAPGRGRFSSITPKWEKHELKSPVEDRYFPIALVAEFPLDKLPTMKQFEDDIEASDSEFWYEHKDDARFQLLDKSLAALSLQEEIAARQWVLKGWDYEDDSTHEPAVQRALHLHQSNGNLALAKKLMAEL